MENTRMMMDLEEGVGRRSYCSSRIQCVCFLVCLLGCLCARGEAFVAHERSSLVATYPARQSRLHAVEFGFFSNWAPPATLDSGELSNYAPAAASLFNNMKLPAAVVTAGMISLGFATSFPELPQDGQFTQDLQKRCESLRRLHIVVALISVTSELIAVLWAAVEVNQLTERALLPSASVWDLIQRDCDLAWSAVNSHFVLGIIGFCVMLSIRAYVMLLAAKASRSLTSAAMTGTAAALCLMISVVNRGVESGGGEGVGYGKTILDLLQHYVWLLWSCAMDVESPGPLELSAIGLETASIGFALQVLLSGNDELERNEYRDAKLVKEDSTILASTNDMVKEEPSLAQHIAEDHKNLIQQTADHHNATNGMPLLDFDNTQVRNPLIGTVSPIQFDTAEDSSSMTNLE